MRNANEFAGWAGDGGGGERISDSQKQPNLHGAPRVNLRVPTQWLKLSGSQADRLMSTTALQQSKFAIPKMDCSSEERLVRMALEGPDVRSLNFDLPGRQLTVVHIGPAQDILSRLVPLNLGAELKDSAAAQWSGAARHKTTFSLPKMDCSSEESMVRMALADEAGLAHLAFDLQNRQLTAVHEGTPDQLLQRLLTLNLGAEVLSSEQDTSENALERAPGDHEEARVLKVLLAINGAMFIIEILVGFLAQSTGLIADSLDMFADAAVFALALAAVGKAHASKVRAAHLAGWLQVILAVFALGEVVRRALFGSEPQSVLMMGMGAVALAANATSLMLAAKKRDSGAHMKASYIFSATDVIANLGVILAGLLVAWSGSPYPDFIVGTVIAAVVMNGARRILRLK